MIVSYYTDFYSMILLPIGLILYAAIRYGSDFSVSNKDVIIYTALKTDTQNTIEAKDQVLFHMQKIRGKNDSNFIIKGLPLKLGEFFTDVIEHCDMPEPESNYNTFKALIEFYGIGAFINNILCTCEVNSHEVAARIAYDKFMDEGTYFISKPSNFESILLKNNIILAGDLCFDTLSRNLCRSKVEIFNLSPLNYINIISRSEIFSENSALLRILLSFSTVKVTNCW